VPKNVEGELTAVVHFDADPFEVYAEETTFSVK
jgi:hypothetical protein